MDVRHLIAALHIVTFGIGAASCWMRADALRQLKDESGLKKVFAADNWWGIAALLWLGTGLWRAFGGIEKGTEFYIHDTAFLIKMAIFTVVIVLELKPMITLIRWRIRQAKGQPIDISSAPVLAQLSYIELILLIPIVVMATAIARGIWY